MALPVCAIAIASGSHAPSPSLRPPRLGSASTAPASRDTLRVYEEPYHHLVYQNQLVRLLDVRVPAGATTRYHVHAEPLMLVVIRDARSTDQTLGDSPKRRGHLDMPDAPGTVNDNFTRTLPYTHRVANLDTIGFQYITAEMRASSGVSAPALPSSHTTRLEQDNPRARVYRVMLAPGDSTESHVHAQPGLTVQVGAGHLTLEGDDPLAAGGSGAGAWWWRGAHQRHILKNRSSAPIEIVEIDWK